MHTHIHPHTHQFIKFNHSSTQGGECGISWPTQYKLEKQGSSLITDRSPNKAAQPPPWGRYNQSRIKVLPPWDFLEAKLSDRQNGPDIVSGVEKILVGR